MPHLHPQRAAGRLALALLLAGLHLPAWAMDTPAVLAIANRMVAAAKTVRPDTRSWHWTLSIMPAGRPDAASRAGGRLIVNAALMQQLTANQMAFMLAHEASHLLHRDPWRTPQFARRHPQDGRALLAFKRQEEYQADRDGLLLMARAGYDPRAAPYALLRLSAAWDADPFADDTRRDHPAGSKRINRLQQAMPRAMWLYRQARRY